MVHSRRNILQYGATGLGIAALSGLPQSAFGAIKNLAIASNVNLPSWDPTVGLGAVNPTVQGVYQSVFDQFIYQETDLSFSGGLITKWGWNTDKTKIEMTVRKGVKWHDGSDFTAEDVVWSLERAGNEKTGNPIQFIWSTIGNFSIKGNKITADVLRFDPTIFKWFSFLTGYVLPKDYYTRVGAEGFEKKPIGTGPYMVERFERNAFIRLKANPNYWGKKPAFKTVTIKFITDAASRVAEVESGRSHVTLEVPYEEYDRLVKKSNLSGKVTPISDIAMIFLNDIEVMTDRNVRLAAHHAINKQLLIDRLLNGYGVAIDTLQTPEYVAYDKNIKVGYDPEKAMEYLAKSGYSKDNPVSFSIQTTRGFKPKDYEMIQAIVGMWRNVGIKAKIEIYEVAKHYELRAADKLAPAAFYNWGNAVGDPSSSTGFAMFGPTPHSVWDGQDLIDAIGPLWGEKNEKKRIAGYQAVDKLIAEEGYVIPLLQYAQPVVYASELKFDAPVSGAVRPSLFK